MALSDRIPYQALVDRPKLNLPDGKRVAVWVILNVEEWRIEKPMPRTVLPPPMGQPLLPDVPNWSWHEYGMRSGFWRQWKALTDRNIPVSCAINGHVCESYPRVAGAAFDAGWEFMGHGYLQGPMHKLDDQEPAIVAALDGIESFCGTRPRSWESPGLTETEETLDLLRKHGVEYVADWVIDDLPQDIDDAPRPPHDPALHRRDQRHRRLRPTGPPLGRIPHAGAATSSTGSMPKAHDNARVMAISIHPYITGVPHRIRYLEELLDHVGSHAGDWPG